jgi:hypothetical protein
MRSHVMLTSLTLSESPILLGGGRQAGLQLEKPL